MNLRGDYTERRGDLIEEALQGKFDLVGHGCNCFCKMKSGIAPLMHEKFNNNDPRFFPWESLQYKGDIRKLGNFEAADIHIGGNNYVKAVNIYSQYYYAYHENYVPSPDGIPLDYSALRLALRKINFTYPNKTIGLPMIGCGKAGGDWKKVSQIIKEELFNMSTYIVMKD